MPTAIPALSRPALNTLRYFRRGEELDAGKSWLPDSRTPPGRLAVLVRAGLISRAAAPNADCYRITARGIAAVERICPVFRAITGAA